MVQKHDLKRGQGDAPFNMATLFYFRLNELLNIKSRAKLSKDLDGWNTTLQEIYTSISFKLSEQENTELQGQIKKIHTYLYAPLPSYDRNAQAQARQIIEGRVYTWLVALDVRIMQLMENHKMIFPRIDTRHPMHKHMEDMSIGSIDGGE